MLENRCSGGYIFSSGHSESIYVTASAELARLSCCPGSVPNNAGLVASARPTKPLLHGPSKQTIMRWVSGIRDINWLSRVRGPLSWTYPLDVYCCHVIVGVSRIKCNQYPIRIDIPFRQCNQPSVWDSKFNEVEHACKCSRFPCLAMFTKTIDTRSNISMLQIDENVIDGSFWLTTHPRTCVILV